jgi:hypothetical protein
VILVYNVGSDRIFWAGLRDRTLAKTFVDQISADGIQSASRQWVTNTASALMVGEVHLQLMAPLGVISPLDIPQPYEAADRDWGDDPGGGATSRTFTLIAIKLQWT